ncbi:hypothetical protein [Ferrimonas balearica]|uniref:hypothetical protein n=1 Tax=Ferrimonas balearica TaxID=44012 RepID=UPI001F2AE3D1|nr:hypothetical protein [Ferrimonas balearica]MBY6095786.1 hypothetical protein [Ferrimonas balearica]
MQWFLSEIRRLTLVQRVVISMVLQWVIALGLVASALWGLWQLNQAINRLSNETLADLAQQSRHRQSQINELSVQSEQVAGIANEQREKLSRFTV